MWMDDGMSLIAEFGGTALESVRGACCFGKRSQLRASVALSSLLM